MEPISCTTSPVFLRKGNKISTVQRSIYIVLIKAKINVLLPFAPLAIMLHYLTGKQGWVFFFSLLGMAPLAERLDYVTEQLVCYMKPAVGGLLNSMFSNATEMITSIIALQKGQIRVVQQSLLGSILSNMLLVLGCAFFCGGVVHHRKVQHFNKANAHFNLGMLLMAVMGLFFPVVLHFTHSEVDGKSEIALSRFISCIILVAYASYLFFKQTRQSHIHSSLDELTDSDKEDSHEEEEVPEISSWEALGWLCLLITWTSILAEYLVDAINGVSDAMNIPVTIISAIVLPIVGNASAIMSAMTDELDITLGIAMGSSIHISGFLIPYCVILGWIIGKPMDLNFQLFETATLLIAVLVVGFMLQEGHTQYFNGLMLIMCYLIVSAGLLLQGDP